MVIETRVNEIKEASQLYAVTLTLHPSFRLRKTSQEQYDKVKDVVKSFFSPYKASIIMELTKNADVHVHAMIESKQCLAKLNYTLKNRTRHFKELGFSMVKLVDDYYGWIDYMVKDLAETSELLRKEPIIRDSLDILPTPLDRIIKIKTLIKRPSAEGSSDHLLH